VPIDVILDDALGRDDLKAYMPSMAFCQQESPEILKGPIPWEGYFYVAGVGAHWDELLWPECIGKY
jgi:hypothetical protein